MTLRKHEQTPISLQVKPQAHQEFPTLTGSAISTQAGFVLYGYYSMDYLLPGKDKLRILFNHNKSSAQLFLLTSDPLKLQHLPGGRPSSLVADVITRVNRYLIRSDSYSKPLTKEQLCKSRLAQTCIHSLCKLLEKERSLASTDYDEQEELRTTIIELIDQCRDDNFILANNPAVSEGELGRILYDTKQAAQHYQFNRVYPVSRIDQLDFTKINPATATAKPCYVWDSDIHINNDEDLNNALRVICQQYGLEAAQALSDLPANRFKRLASFLRKLFQDGKDWINYLAASSKPHHVNSQHVKETETHTDGLTITKIKPYYHLEGLAQNAHTTLRQLISHYCGSDKPGYSAKSRQDAEHILSSQANGSWVDIAEKKQIIVRLDNKMIALHYFECENLFYPLPKGQDLFTLTQLSKQHLYFPERFSLRLQAFFSQLPQFFKYIYQHLYQFITHDLRDEFINHVHLNHQRFEKEKQPAKSNNAANYRNSLQEVLIGHGMLSNGQTLEQFVHQQISASGYVIVREEHVASPEDYTNPLHRSLRVVRHLGAFFVDTNEKNPIAGTLAIAAYIYGAGAIIAPNTLTAILTKLHLQGLIRGIEPTQALGKWMSHGTIPEAMSAATTYWQAMAIGGDLDRFFISAISVLKDDPAEVAIIVALAISLGYGLCDAIPSLQKEMGRFPYINYAFLGAKGGAAFYDTVMHPGDDWLLGTIKWLLRGLVILGKLLVSPIVEGYFYGYKAGFLSGLKKSAYLFIHTTKQIVAATIDLLLALLTIPLLEISAMVLHVPFRGITSFISKLLGAIGHWEPIGQSLIDFANRPSGWNYLPGFRLSPLYGFTNPIAHYSDNKLLNILANAAMLFLRPLTQLIKNFLVLPIIDLSSFSTRLILTLINPVTRFIALSAGTVIKTAAIGWDPTIGKLFRMSAHLVTYSANALDREASSLKQSLLGLVQILRRDLYDWAFREEDLASHHVNTNNAYFLEKPMRLEQLPHDADTTQCLLSVLLDNWREKPTVIKQDCQNNNNYHPLFGEASQNKTNKSITEQEAILEISHAST